MARNGGIAEDLFGSKEPKKTTGGMGLIEDTEEPLDDTDPVDEEEAKKKKALKRKKKLLAAASKW
jgi:hypothetical protein